MRVAVPVSAGRVSPVFDVAGRLLLVDLDGQSELNRQEVPLGEENPAHRAKHLAQLGIDVLICGAISRPLEMLLLDAGVEVVPHICGDLEAVLQAFRARGLENETFVMPGCCGRRRRFRGGRGHCGRGLRNKGDRRR